MDLAFFAKECGALPRAGGILDQDHYHVQLLRAGLRAINKKEEVEAERRRNEMKSRRGK